MEQKVPNEAMIRDYLLGRLDSDGALAQRIDELMLGDAEFSEIIDVIEDEIIEEYLEGTLNPEDNAAMESHFLRPPERQLKLRQARFLSRRISGTARDPRDEAPKAIREHRFFFPVLRQSRLTYMTYVALAALLFLGFSAAYLVQSRRRLEAQLSQSTQSLVQERERSASLSQQLGLLRTLAQPATVMLSLVQAGVLRGNTIVPELRIGSGTTKIHVEMALLPHVREGQYGLRLESAGGIAWHTDRIQALSSPEGSILMADVPAQVFAQGENRFVVRQKDGSETTYLFVVSKE